MRSAVKVWLFTAGGKYAKGAALETAPFHTHGASYFDTVKSAFVSPDTLIGFDEFFAPSCQAVTV